MGDPPVATRSLKDLVDIKEEESSPPPAEVVLPGDGKVWNEDAKSPGEAAIALKPLPEAIAPEVVREKEEVKPEKAVMAAAAS